MGASLGGSAGGSKKKETATPSINVTPLVDVVLVVLIIFMIVTPMATKTFWLNLPPKPDDKEEDPAPNDNKPLIMTVDKAGVIRMNQTVVPKNEVSERVPRMLAAKGQKVLYFDAHSDASYARAIEAMDLSRTGGVKSIAILTETVMK
jgi:biopolymer transport protein ExbD/biopolymer transport protein TolR